MTRGRASDPSPRQLRLLIVLSEELHFGRAAQRLFISQPVFSRQIRALEETLGLTLVKRSTRRVELTAAGEVLLPHARAVVDAADELRQAAESAGRVGALSGRLILGAYVTALPVIRTIVEHARERHPGLEVELSDIGFVDQAQALLEGRADAVLCFGPVPPGIQAMEVAPEPRLVCLPDTHPLAARDRVTLADLAGLPVIGLADRLPQAWRDYWAADPRPDGSTVRYTDHGATTMEGIVSAVGLGQGIAFVAGAAGELFPRPGIRYLEVVDLPPSSALLTWAASRRDEPGLAAIRGVVREVCATAAVARLGSRWWDTPDQSAPRR
ncbi:LysR substrate-binding domain-containing protein [Streptomyces sp. NPDC029216]|uniref:LysR family transcriptional regulator n=1 Tax=Streptomyces sp. NPDC029216 TaxID=3154701 RepID=UPI0033E9485B